jgi:hypothetical protein
MNDSETDKCHFKFKGCAKNDACYSRAEDAKPTGPFFDACWNCARVPYKEGKP